jgi:multidrug transporter EmrE-like cation transporter
VVAGPDSYKEFVQHTLRTHNNTPLTNHMGLETILVHDWEGRMRFTRDDNLDDPFQLWKQGRLDRHHKLRLVHLGIVALLFGWTVWALRRTKSLWISEALAAPLVMALTNLTCYYYSMFILAAALPKARRPLGPAVLVTSGASQILLLAYYWVDDKFTAQAWLFGIFSLVMLAAYSRPFSMERFKAWWAGKPEPKGVVKSESYVAPAE